MERDMTYDDRLLGEYALVGLVIGEGVGLGVELFDVAALATARAESSY